MTDTTLLEAKIRKSGLKVTYIAESMGISRSSLYRKISNRVPFNQYEIKNLCDILAIKTKNEIDSIFFAPNVD